MARNRDKQFELAFSGDAMVRGFPRHRRWHDSFDGAKETAGDVRDKMRERDIPHAAHNAIVYGPGCGRDGIAV